MARRLHSKKLPFRRLFRPLWSPTERACELAPPHTACLSKGFVPLEMWKNLVLSCEALIELEFRVFSMEM